MFDIKPDRPSRLLTYIGAAILCLLVAGSISAESGKTLTAGHPLVLAASATADDAALLRLKAGSYDALSASGARQEIEIPVRTDSSIRLSLRRFYVTAPDARFMRGLTSTTSRPNVLLYQGTVSGEENSLAFLSVSQRGLVNGFVYDASGRATWIATPAVSYTSGDPVITVTDNNAGDIPDFAEFCGAEFMESMMRMPRLAAGIENVRTAEGPRAVMVAIDGDQQFVQLFGGDEVAAQDYVLQLLGAISTIYRRDLNCKLVLDFLRLWPDGGEPFAASDLNGFRNWWVNNEDTAGIQITHLFSGSRTLPYGGIAYLSGTCTDYAYGIDGYMNGSFPTNYLESTLGSWDIIVAAHEMGHNLGTPHTHDSMGYLPPIDTCAQGYPARGTIMSYCHIHPGYTLNIDMRFHRRVSQLILMGMSSTTCHWRDCNDNNVDDSVDIAEGVSLDTNFDNIPDECQDCNANGILDPDDIAGASSDVNGNGVPDECESDCNGNGVPDEWETATGSVADENGNGVPDECEPDCNNNGIADYVEIQADMSLDLDRDLVLDSCQDCNGNSIPDWQDLERQYNIFVADRNDFIREYLGASGVPIQSLAAGTAIEPYDITIGPDRMLYVASYGTSEILRVDPLTDSVSAFNDSDILNPSALAFGPDGDLYVASNLTSAIYRLDGTTGNLVSIFVSSGTGGLSQPYDLTFGPDGNLFVTSSNNTVLQFNGSTGALVGTFVSAGAGGLDSPRGLAFKPTDDNLLVTSYNSNQVLEYDGQTGAFVGQFNDSLSLDNPWGIAIGPDNDVYVVRSSGTIRIMKYHAETGWYNRALVRNDPPLLAPTAVVFMPASNFDCNANLIPDDCDLANGVLTDADNDNTPDQCAGCCVAMTGNINNDPLDKVDISDLSALVNYLFVTFEEPVCFEEANCNGDPAGVIDISDLSTLVNFLFVTFEQPAACL